MPTYGYSFFFQKIKRGKPHGLEEMVTYALGLFDTRQYINLDFGIRNVQNLSSVHL